MQDIMKIILEHRSFQNIAKFLELQKNCRTRRGPRLVRVSDGDQRSGRDRSSRHEIPRGPDRVFRHLQRGKLV